MARVTRINFLALVTAAIVVFCVAPGHGLECFLCSYSPRGNSSRMDGCTDANFTADQTETRTCAIGCESVAVYDLNGELESFHRNCATNSTIITNSCETYKTIVLTRHVCSCNWSYCNVVSDSGHMITSTFWLIFGPSLACLVFAL
ncbi:uncharacterized protein LOC134777663 [Penaeus indicus]|uniref:uncharacterized protein LOC134777663 n=1 Tax=Penaeus indicus TaxID=29960 RepID=UPI00300CB02D